MLWTCDVDVIPHCIKLNINPFVTLTSSAGAYMLTSAEICVNNAELFTLPHAESCGVMNTIVLISGPVVFIIIVAKYIITSRKARRRWTSLFRLPHDGSEGVGL